MPLQSAEEVQQFVELVQVDESYVEVRNMVTAYEKMGIEKGIEQGIEQGIEKGKLEALLLLLEERFENLPDAIRRKVRRINSSKRIDALLLAVLNAKSISDLNL